MARKLTSLALGVAIAAAGAYWYTSQSGVPTAGVTLNPVGSVEAQEVDTSGIVEMTLGAADAPITVVEYASFTCPHCATFHQNVFPELKENYIETGKVQFIYREVYFDRFGLWAGMVARCGGEERYFGITDMLYEQQSEWTGNGSPAEVADNLRRIGRVAGMSDEQVDACLQDGEKAQALVAWYQQNAEADGINSTPSFVINGENYSNMNFRDFAAVLDGLLEE
ncbi:putative thiol-disulfide oxidoreductase D [Dinoroseobacter shibae DFL 12 = DSM 16493]|jgi:protein-disulfide isomerase|uniref:Putative thiol-disulfide oxidoreductase D n=1 Tax=Dinoroseobacter shibae (strain DSM 16493 / NCIMB 14021 / DFL 12) TaxID=398580 RepID=A8LJV3_DINSH|nr:MULTISPECIES: DsbA family protein [Dinoroseobacter]ABV91779.1 putative thiol-disulfide oxidoreductase D [Dinoroseobacter shibae DFL 12 = DSM 16493]MDD9717175.1 DsbA family protein [Dinoroseobacter sp. PD6]URF46761.1 DsbA family protein [Dinoroseobacter shibae]URF51072.1 DsbA family protein [Dinoroseobacter shibae]